VEWKGYVPLRRHDGRPFVVLIGESAQSVVDRIPPGSRVKWGRDKGAGESVYVLEWNSGHPWRYYWPAVLPDADLVAWLVRLWRLPDLAPALKELFVSQCQPAVTDAPPAEAKPEYPADAPPELVARMRERGQAVQVEEARPLDLDQFGFPLPSQNGNGKH